MARPFTATDDDILQAAGKVMARRGPDGFSMAEVAADVGLSRAAIILRFKSTHALKVTLLNRMVERFAAALKSLPQTPGADNLLRLTALIGGFIRTRERLASFFVTYNTNIADPDLRALEIKRGQILRMAISNVMPKVAIEHSSAVLAFSAHLTGSIMAWAAVEGEDARHYLLIRTQEWLTLSGIESNEEVLQELLAVSPEPESANTTQRRGKSSRLKRRAPR